MAVHADAYGTVARVEALVGDVVASRTFSTTTTPTKAQVEDIISDVGHELNNYLKTFGYTAPATSTDTYAHAQLIAANNGEAAARVLATTPTAAQLGSDFSDDEEFATRVRGWHNQFTRVLTLIEKGRLAADRDSGFKAHPRLHRSERNLPVSAPAGALRVSLRSTS